MDTESPKQLENRIVHVHLTHLKLLQSPLLEPTIPTYIQSLPAEEQQMLLRRAGRWLRRYWNKRSQTLRHAHYLASVGEYNEETLCAYLFIFNYAAHDLP